MDAHQQRMWEARYRLAAQPKLDEPVLAAALFHRPGRLGGFLSRLGRRRPAAGLPETFLMAVTPMKMHAFAANIAGGELRVHEEVAVWERAAVQVTVATTRARSLVTISSEGSPERVVCATGKDPLSRSVIRYMVDPAVVAA